MFDQIVGCANDVVMVAEVSDGQTGYKITYVNESFCRLFGYNKSEIIGQSPRVLNGPETSESTVAEISEAVHSGQQVRRRILNYTKRGKRVWMEINIVPLVDCEGRFSHFAAIERDVTDQVVHEEELATLATTDPLTQLNNRRAFSALLAEETQRATHENGQLWLAAVDLDHFKLVNDRYGHDSGDEVLVAFARLLEACFPAGEHVARVGGEEFSVLVPGKSLGCARRSLERLRQNFHDATIALKCGVDLRVTCSVGLTDFRLFQDDAASFAKRADAALYEAKRDGRNRVVVFGSRDEDEALQVA